jgi:hypothetical protein
MISIVKYLFEETETQIKKRLDDRFEKTKNLRRIGVAGNTALIGGASGLLALQHDNPTLTALGAAGGALVGGVGTHLAHKAMWKKYREQEMAKAKNK